MIIISNACEIRLVVEVVCLRCNFEDRKSRGYYLLVRLYYMHLQLKWDITMCTSECPKNRRAIFSYTAKLKCQQLIIFNWILFRWKDPPPPQLYPLSLFFSLTDKLWTDCSGDFFFFFFFKHLTSLFFCFCFSENPVFYMMFWISVVTIKK